ncbi:MAG: hypothetical protein GX579_11000 [Chloroflexi bacterium]|jgi:uncharacterized membrane protein|nr:hypothetical protein [Chloroflexota bacterium]
MEENKSQQTDFTASDNDRLWAALAWLPISPLWPLFAVLALLLDDTKNRPFVRYHAIVSLALGIALIPISVITLGCGAIVYLVFFWWAFEAYNGRVVEIPVISDWVRQQGWADL